MQHLSVFAKSAGVTSDTVHVRFTLADGTTLHLRGLRTFGVAGGGSWGRIQGALPSSKSAVLVREAHVLKAEFELAPDQHRPIGLHTEAESA
jgi:hypothetical protein